MKMLQIPTPSTGTDTQGMEGSKSGSKKKKKKGSKRKKQKKQWTRNDNVLEDYSNLFSLCREQTL